MADLRLEDVDDSELNIDDIGDLVEEMEDVAIKFKSIGIAFRIKLSELNIFEKNHRHDPRAGLTSVLQEWLNLNYSAKRGEAKKMPSWRWVVEVVDKSAGGSNHALAKKIAANHLIPGRSQSVPSVTQSIGTPPSLTLQSNQSSTQSLSSLSDVERDKVDPHPVPPPPVTTTPQSYQEQPEPFKQSPKKYGMKKLEQKVENLENQISPNLIQEDPIAEENNMSVESVPSSQSQQLEEPQQSVTHNEYLRQQLVSSGPSNNQYPPSSEMTRAQASTTAVTQPTEEGMAGKLLIPPAGLIRRRMSDELDSPVNPPASASINSNQSTAPQGTSSSSTGLVQSMPEAPTQPTASNVQQSRPLSKGGGYHGQQQQGVNQHSGQNVATGNPQNQQNLAPQNPLNQQTGQNFPGANLSNQQINPPYSFNPPPGGYPSQAATNLASLNQAATNQAATNQAGPNQTMPRWMMGCPPNNFTPPQQFVQMNAQQQQQMFQQFMWMTGQWQYPFVPPGQAMAPGYGFPPQQSGGVNFNTAKQGPSMSNMQAPPTMPVQQFQNQVSQNLPPPQDASMPVAMATTETGDSGEVLRSPQQEINQVTGEVHYGEKMLEHLNDGQVMVDRGKPVTQYDPLSRDCKFKPLRLSCSPARPTRDGLDRYDQVPDNERYNMTKTPHGIAVIINNKTFKHEDRRIGTDIDCRDLVLTFRYLGYIVLEYKDLKRDEILDVIDRMAKLEEFRLKFNGETIRDHSNFDSFVCCILSHGENDVVFGIDSHKVQITNLTYKLRSDVCPSLAGKPKMFFIQACRGPQMDGGETNSPSPPDSMIANETREAVIDAPASKVADFFVGYSTSPDFVSFRDPVKGSWYIWELCMALCSMGTCRPLRDIMDEVSTKVNQEHSFQTSRQAPVYSCSLRRKIFFWSL